MTLRFHTGYFAVTLILLFTEVVIAMHVHDAVVRPYIGDLLVVILLYCLVRTFLSASVLPVALGVLLFSFLIEAGQYFHLVDMLGLAHSAIARVVLGNFFAWMDLVMYIAGIVCVMILEKIRSQSSLDKNN